MAKRPVKLIVISDFGCPWCFIGHRELQTAVAQSANLPVAFEIEYRPFLLHPNMPNEPISKDEFVKRKIGRERWETCKRMAVERGEEHGINFSFAGPASMTLNAHRLVSKAYELAGSAVQSALFTLIFRAYCEDDLDINDYEVLADAAEQSGAMSKVEALRFLKSDECLEKVNNQVAEARAKGVTGVPFTIIDGKWAVSGSQSAPVYVKIFNKLSETPTVPPSQSTTPVQATAVAVA
jgi:predicted DsbA family dithiol-disulfide isomerase